MSVLTAVVILLSVVVAADTLLTIGIVRRLRAGGLAPVEGQVATWLSPGFEVDPIRDETEWPRELQLILQGEWLIAITVYGCPGCETLRREIKAKSPLGVKVCVLVDPTSGTRDQLDAYLEKWDVDLRSVAPDAYDAMLSLGSGPPSYPALVLIRHGYVVQTGGRVRQMDQLADSRYAAP